MSKARSRKVTPPLIPVGFDAGVGVMVNGVRYEFSPEEIKEFSRASEWHNPGDPTTALVVKMVSQARCNFSVPLGRSGCLDLVAATLKIPAERVEQILDWDANYNAMHDGRDVRECHTWPAGG